MLIFDTNTLQVPPPLIVHLDYCTVRRPATKVMGRAADDAQDWRLDDGDETGAVETDGVAEFVLTTFVDFCTEQWDYEC